MFLIKNLISAFSMFSALPMPNIQYNEKNTKYMMAFFPFIGLTLGAFIFFWIEICQKLCLGNIFLSLGIVIIPPVISGFIHLDGFMDTLDALASHGTKEKMLSIMKDSHVGAFAVIGLLIYFFLYFAICYELEKSQKTII
ncbi:MAG: adenosylcobinamide-GDP ribazoletransferase, partial [Oscillospiraceae bacterium]